MSLKQKAKDSGVFRASDLAMLGRVFDETSVTNETEEERSARATRILDFFLAGIVDELELRTLARPLVR